MMMNKHLGILALELPMRRVFNKIAQNCKKRVCPGRTPILSRSLRSDVGACRQNPRPKIHLKNAI